MKISTEAIMGIIVVIVFFGFTVPYLVIDFKQAKIERECLNNIAEDFCNERGLDYIWINGANRFFVCGDERTILEDGYNYKFTNEEKDYCYHLATRTKGGKRR